MKNIYAKTCLLLFSLILQLYFPVRLDAQCLCDGGIPATPITQSITIPPTTSSNLNLSFPQFDPTVGTLSCVRMYDTISAVSYSGARNTNPDTTIFKFLLSVTSEITGPGIDISQDFSKIYGPDTLAPYGD